MTLLAILLALGAAALFGTARDHGLRRFGSLLQVPDWPLAAALWVLAPAMLAGWIGADLPSAVLRMLFGAAVLFLCLGPADLTGDIYRTLSAHTGGDAISSTDEIADPVLHGARDLLGAVFVAAHERYFGVLIWFVAAGPGGALLYRIASRLRANADSRAQHQAQLLHALVAWVPTRITALLYGLAGSTDDALAAWRRLPQNQESLAQRSWTVLTEVGRASLTVEEHGAATDPPDLSHACGEALHLQRRALLLFLALCALYSAGAWLT